jgi:hypothetical protein
VQPRASGGHCTVLEVTELAKPRLGVDVATVEVRDVAAPSDDRISSVVRAPNATVSSKTTTTSFSVDDGDMALPAWSRREITFPSSEARLRLMLARSRETIGADEGRQAWAGPAMVASGNDHSVGYSWGSGYFFRLLLAKLERTAVTRRRG